MSKGREDPRETGFRPITPRGADPDLDETRIILGEERSPGVGPTNPSSGAVDEGRTVVQGYGRPAAPVAAGSAAPAPVGRPAIDAAPVAGGARLAASDMVILYGPVVGWLVVLQGPGRGNAVAFYQGMNSVGRAADQRVVIDFGDPKISRESHFFVTFDPKNKSYHINHGGKGNLLYLDDQAVLGPMPLRGGEMIEIGDTKLRVVPLCGPDFVWDERE